MAAQRQPGGRARQTTLHFFHWLRYKERMSCSKKKFLSTRLPGHAFSRCVAGAALALLLAFPGPGHSQPLSEGVVMLAQTARRQPAHLASPAASASRETPAPAAAAGETKAKEGPIKLFGTVEFRRPLDSLPVWLDVIKRNKADPIFQPVRRLNSQATWHAFREAAKTKTGLELLRYVNSFWNTWPYKEDLANWGKPDYWAIPAQFLKKSGDCEDYAIAKYFTLRELGIPADDMRIVVLRDTLRNLAHAVLVVYMNGDAYVLDNLSNAVLSHNRFRHYSPQYSANESGRWAHVRGKQKK